MRERLLMLVVLVISGCGGGPSAVPDTLDAAAAQPDAPEVVCNDADIATTLVQIAGVSNLAEVECNAPARCFTATFAQPVHHDTPGDVQLQQRLSVIHRGCDRPTVMVDSGYARSISSYDGEITKGWGTNVIALEHRYQGESSPATWDWNGLSISNGANDMHRVVSAFRPLYKRNWLTTGASKGGITAIYHRRTFPEDVDGTVAYVAPASRARIDAAYQQHMAEALPAACASGIVDFQIAALTTRRAMMTTRLAAIAGEADADWYLEAYLEHFDWGFWQRVGVNACAQVPTASSSDDEFWSFFAFVNQLDVAAVAAADPPEEYRDIAGLWYEWLTEQGFALQVNPAIVPYFLYPKTTMEDDFRALFPDAPLPAFDPTSTLQTRAYVENAAENLLLIYGQYDPWSGGAFAAPMKPSSSIHWVPNATHGAVASRLPSDERDQVLFRISELLGDTGRSGAQKPAFAPAQTPQFEHDPWNAVLELKLAAHRARQ
ncbi:MAG: S28 family serine protease [Kofleriaceae bacterium]